MFRDKYTDFWFDDKSSAKFKVWMTNKHDLQNNLSPAFTDKFNAPTYAQTRYYEGTTLTNQDLKVSCAAVGITRNEWRAIAEWFSPLKTGKLVFDWNPSHYYMVKVSKQPTNTIWALNKVDSVLGEIYIVTFDLTFTTINDWAALSQPAAIGMSVYNGTEFREGYTHSESFERYKNEYFIPSMLTREDIDTNSSWITWNSCILLGGQSVTITGSTGSATIYDFTGDIFATLTYSNNQMNINYSYGTTSLTETISGNSVTFNNLGFNYLCKADSGWNVKLETPKSQLICNAGTYDIYPNINGVIKDCKLYDNFYTYYKATAIDYPNSSDTFPFSYDSKTGILSSLGQLLGQKNLIDESYFKDDYESKSLSIESGRPEMIKGYLVSKNVVQEEGNTNPVQVPTLKIKVNQHLKYGRDSNFIVHLFLNKPDIDSNIYGVDFYGGQANYTAGEFDSGEHWILMNPILEEEEDNNNLYLKITGIPNIKCKPYDSISSVFYGDSNFNSLDIDQYIYISICDTSTLYEYHEEEDDNNKDLLTVEIQNRDMM